jgi:hypothetical protein
MLHGIFHTFTRYYDHGYQEINLFGHNVYWQAVVYVTEKAEGRGSNLLGLNLRWDRENDMACDVNNGHTLPNNAMLCSLGLDISGIWDRMKSHRFRRDCYVDTSPHMTLGHVTPFRVYSRASAPFFLHQSYYIQHNRVSMQQRSRAKEARDCSPAIKQVYQEWLDIRLLRKHGVM